MKLDLLSVHQVEVPDALEVIRAQQDTPVSDFAVGTGNTGTLTQKGHKGTGRILLKNYEDGKRNILYKTGLDSVEKEYCGAAIRPIIQGQEAKDIYAHAHKKIQPIKGRTFEVILFGGYPQDIDWENYFQLEFMRNHPALCDNKLKKTGKVYTLNQNPMNLVYGDCELKETPEYEYMGKCYVRALIPLGMNTKINGICARSEHACWYEVQPIEWVKDPSGILIAKKGLISGVPAKEAETFMDKYLSKEILPLQKPERVKFKERDALFSMQLLKTSRGR